jgi:hypothetical protein
MIFTLCFKVDLMRLFGCFKRPEVDRLSLNADVRLPVVSVSGDTKQPRRRTLLAAAPIFSIRCCGSLPKICNSVVRSFAVYVVNKFRRLFPVVMHPRQAMRSMTSAKSKYAQVSAMVFAARIIPHMYSLGNFFTPVKNTRCKVIIKHISNVFGRYFHGANLSTYVQHRGSIA